MNYFTKLSIDLANQRNYLDQLFSVYPLIPDSIRDIDETKWNCIETAYNNNDNETLLRSLLELDLFPIKDGYIPYLRKDKKAIDRNPSTVNRICGRIRELGIDKLYERCSEPKETNRQMGPLFRRWIENGTLGIFPVEKEIFHNTAENAILKGGDTLLKEYAKEYLGYEREDNKGIDFLARFNGKYVIGEAKFISDEGGHQNDQFLDAMTALKTKAKNANVINIAILDGVLYIHSKRKMYKMTSSSDLPILSALLLRDYLYSL